MIYTIYFEPFVLTIGSTEFLKNSQTDVYDGKSPGLKQVINEWKEGHILNDIAIASNDPAKTYKRICSMFTTVYAAGGLVMNNNRDLLMIHRLGKWDLPKGKIDAGEDAQTAAKREVTEETGVKNLKIIRLLTSTWHIYKISNARWVLKKTDWFVMRSDYTGSLKPQENENIMQAIWMDAGKLSEIAPESYRSIYDLIQHFEKTSM